MGWAVNKLGEWLTGIWQDLKDEGIVSGQAALCAAFCFALRRKGAKEDEEKKIRTLNRIVFAL